MTLSMAPSMTPSMALWVVVVVLVVLALLFDFMNGFHDAANSIATVVSTGVLKPTQAVAFAAFFNVVAIFVFHLKVAATVGKGIVEPGIVDQYVIFGALIGAISWNVITWWWYGIPSSSSHALIGGIVGATLAKAGATPLLWSGLLKTVAFIFISPLLGFLLGLLLMVTRCRQAGSAGAATSPSAWARCSAAGASSRPWGSASPGSSRWVGFVPRPVAP